jgi:hypothetical protein
MKGLGKSRDARTRSRPQTGEIAGCARFVPPKTAIWQVNASVKGHRGFYQKQGNSIEYQVFP